MTTDHARRTGDSIAETGCGTTVRHLRLLDVAANVHLNPSLDRRLAEPSKSRNVQSAVSIQRPILSREQGGLWRTAHRAFDIWLWRYGVSAADAELA